MYKYEFVKIELKGEIEPVQVGEDYHDIIASYAKEGWRFVQIFTPVLKSRPFMGTRSSYYELIFEREIEG